MSKHYLQSRIKSTGTAYLFWFFFGAHYAYLGNWGIQLLYWITLGGLGIWALIDLFTMSSKINNYNEAIFRQIEAIEKKEKDEAHERNLAMITAAGNSK